VQEGTKLLSEGVEYHYSYKKLRTRCGLYSLYTVRGYCTSQNFILSSPDFIIARHIIPGTGLKGKG
jgi:hypothetical protein